MDAAGVCEEELESAVDAHRQKIASCGIEWRCSPETKAAVQQVLRSRNLRLN
jgi:hypothetical protein